MLGFLNINKEKYIKKVVGFGLLVFGKLLIYYLRPTTKNPQPFFIYFCLLIFENPARKSKGKIGQKGNG